MIRITQTYLIKQAIKYYEEKEWTTLYFDFPGGQRSGIGNRAKVNKIWESTYNLSPDIVFYKDQEIRIFEVDKVLHEYYILKFLKYKQKENEVIKHLNNIFNYEIIQITYGFVAQTKNINVILDKNLLPFYYLYYDNGDINESQITSSEK